MDKARATYIPMHVAHFVKIRDPLCNAKSYIVEEFWRSPPAKSRGQVPSVAVLQDETVCGRRGVLNAAHESDNVLQQRSI